MADTPASDLNSDGKSPLSPPAGGNKRETLTSRAKRIIGRALDSPKKEESSAAGKKGPPKKSPSRRREQVLQAQRTHRQRTQGYIRELEKEVLRLRESEASLKKQNGALLQRATALEQILTSNNVPMPSDLPPTSPLPVGFDIDLNETSPYLSTEGYNSNPSDGQPTPQPLFSDIDLSQPASFGTDPSAGFVNVDFTHLANRTMRQMCNFDEVEEFDEVNFTAPARATLPAHNEPSGRPTLNSQQALDFVLAIENMCFGHVAHELINHPRPPPGDPQSNHGAGHVYSALTNLVSRRLPESPTAEPFQYPKPDLDKLFHLSLHVDFGTEVTPIQIWANLVRLSGLGYVVSPDFVIIFLEELHKYARCNGYGAVVEKDTVDRLIQFYFPGQVFTDSWTPQL